MARRRCAHLVASGIAVLVASVTSLASGRADWTTYHLDPARSGNDTSEPSFAHPAAGWNASLDGDVYGTPVTTGPTVIAATENDTVYAFDIASGGIRWATRVGTPVTAGLPCGNINPLGITGTPVIDAASGVVWVVAEEVGPKHELVGLSVADGHITARFNADPPGMQPLYQQQRGALALANGRVYIPFGGLNGDCGPYHGWVVGIDQASGTQSIFEVAAAPPDARGGIWGPSGPAVDGSGNVYVSTGNSDATSSSSTYDWSDGVIKLSPTLAVEDFFAPQQWYQDNLSDLDLGSVGPSLLSGGLLFQVARAAPRTS